MLFYATDREWNKFSENVNTHDWFKGLRVHDALCIAYVHSIIDCGSRIYIFTKKFLLPPFVKLTRIEASS